MCGALRAGTSYAIPTKNHLGEKCIIAPSPLKVPVAVASVLALVMRAGRDVGGVITGFAARGGCPLCDQYKAEARHRLWSSRGALLTVVVRPNARDEGRARRRL
jgi:hypothetical protein